MKVPSFSNGDAAGRKTWANSRARSLKNKSCTMTQIDGAERGLRPDRVGIGERDVIADRP